MKIAVIGANGDWGRSLVPYLLNQDHEVVSIDLSIPSGILPIPTASARYVVANANDFGELVSSVEGCEAIVHLAAHRSPANRARPVTSSGPSIFRGVVPTMRSFEPLTGGLPSGAARTRARGALRPRGVRRRRGAPPSGSWRSPCTGRGCPRGPRRSRRR